jgi:hypothetical protein
MKIKDFITILFLLLIMFLYFDCKSQKNIKNQLSGDIFNKQISVFGENIFLTGINNYLQLSNWQKEFNFSTINDTLFLLELPGIQGDYYFSVWNKKDTLSYFEEFGIYKLVHNKTVFTRYMMNLVSDWNINEIREEEKNHSNFSPSETIYATRIIINNKKYIIDCLEYKDFFNFDRDRWDFQ